MKKIVALVLALALALSLCTVAFAVTSTDGTKSEVSVSFTKVTLYELDDTAGSSKGAIASESNIKGITKTTQTGEIRNDVAYYNADKYTLTYADGSTELFSVVAKDYANYSLKLDKNAEIYLVDENIDTEYVFVTKVAKASKLTCGAYTTTENGTKRCAAYLDEDGNAYVAVTDPDDANWAYFKGAFVPFGGEAYAKAHDFDVTDTTGAAYTNTYKLDSDNVLVPVTATCKDCKNVYNVVDETDKDWVENVNFVKVQEFNKTQYFVVLDSAVAGTTAATTVDSSKTFDAGVAMYVGLSLMSVAGSAVVIGKKKEF